MYRMGGRDRELCSKCRRASCLHPKMCPNLDNDHRPLLDLYAKVRAVKGVKKAFIGSGIRTTCSMAAITSIRSSATIPRAASKWRRNIPRILC